MHEVRNEYYLDIVVNKRKIEKEIVSQHYKASHPELNDQLILELVKKLNGSVFTPEDSDDEFQYFAECPIFLYDNPYKLVFLLYINEDNLGVLTAFRIKKCKIGECNE